MLAAPEQLAVEDEAGYAKDPDNLRVAASAIELLPTLLGGLKGATGSFAGAFLLFALAGLTCAAILAAISPIWEREFVGRGGLATQSA